MKITICDVCNSKNILRTSEYRASVKTGTGSRIALDVCEEHKRVFKGKTFDQALKFATECIKTRCFLNEVTIG